MFNTSILQGHQGNHTRRSNFQFKVQPSTLVPAQKNFWILTWYRVKSNVAGLAYFFAQICAIWNTLMHILVTIVVTGTVVRTGETSHRWVHQELTRESMQHSWHVHITGHHGTSFLTPFHFFPLPQTSSIPTLYLKRDTGVQERPAPNTRMNCY